MIESLSDVVRRAILQDDQRTSLERRQPIQPHCPYVLRHIYIIRAPWRCICADGRYPSLSWINMHSVGCRHVLLRSSHQLAAIGWLEGPSRPLRGWVFSCLRLSAVHLVYQM